MYVFKKILHGHKVRVFIAIVLRMFYFTLRVTHGNHMMPTTSESLRWKTNVEATPTKEGAVNRHYALLT